MARANRTIERLASPWLLDPGDLGVVTIPPGRTAPRPVLFDIGVGRGEAAIAWARARPEALVLAIEVHRPSIAGLLRMLDREDGPQNLRVVVADARLVLAEAGARSIAATRVLFPDPWPKRRHIGRRLVDDRFAAQAARVLVSGGELTLATDWPPYADQMRAVCANQPDLQPMGDEDRPDRPLTPYEKRGLDAGRPIADLRYRRVDADDQQGGWDAPPPSTRPGVPTPGTGAR